jgi:hypothetical protein
MHLLYFFCKYWLFCIKTCEFYYFRRAYYRKQNDALTLPYTNAVRHHFTPCYTFPKVVCNYHHPIIAALSVPQALTIATRNSHDSVLLSWVQIALLVDHKYMILMGVWFAFQSYHCFKLYMFHSKLCNSNIYYTYVTSSRERKGRDSPPVTTEKVWWLTGEPATSRAHQSGTRALCLCFQRKISFVVKSVTPNSNVQSYG